MVQYICPVVEYDYSGEWLEFTIRVDPPGVCYTGLSFSSDSITRGPMKIHDCGEDKPELISSPEERVEAMSNNEFSYYFSLNILGSWMHALQIATNNGKLRAEKSLNCRALIGLHF